MLKLTMPDNDREPDLEVELPWPPTVNQYRMIGLIFPKLDDIKAHIADNGWDGFHKLLQRRTIRKPTIKPVGKRFREAVGWLLLRTQTRFGDARVCMECVLHPPSGRKFDIDNFNKALFDALEHHGIFDDDAQISQLLLTKGAVVSSGFVEIRIWRIPA